MTIPSRILVTGATGFLGGVVARQLVQAGYYVRTTGRSSAAPHLPNYQPADLDRADDMTRLVRGIDVVIHSAGLAHQFQGAPSLDDYMRTNALAVGRLAEAAARNGVRRFVLVSSVSVYGSEHPAVCAETDPCRPDSPYGQSKLAGEEELTLACRDSAMEPVALRMATLYGEGDPGNVARLMRSIARNRFVSIGRGNNRKSLIHVEDAARACVYAATSHEKSRHRHYNVCGETVAMRDVVGTLSRTLGKGTPRFYVPAAVPKMILRPLSLLPVVGRKAKRIDGTIGKWLKDDVYDGGRFAREFDFHPQVLLAEGLCREVAWFKDVTFIAPPAAAERRAA